MKAKNAHFTDRHLLGRSLPRAAGILMPLSSLPSAYGIGSMGAAARKWVDWLQAAGQTYWQVLPLGPTGFADSPYQSCSAFAGNPYFIDLDTLRDAGLLQARDYVNLDWGSDDTQVDYAAIYRHREAVLRKAFARFEPGADYAVFREQNAGWLDDYALYMAVKTENKLSSWEQWDDDIRLREPKTIAEYKIQLANDISYHIFLQYVFFTQWHALKQYANERGIKIVGDIPIYVSMDSADAWANSALFYLDEDKQPIAVAGVPPDLFSKTGQLWGNPLYRWDVMAKDGYGWWLKRLEACFQMYDVLRIDHFRGLEAYYAIPYGNATAERGRWMRGPGHSFIRAVNARFPGAAIIAEDLGVLTDRVLRLLKGSGYPGMKILHFAFGDGESDYLPHRYERNCVVYTGTHDNDTTLGWLGSAPQAERKKALAYAGIKNIAGAHWPFIRMALGSVADTAIIPMADYLGQGSEGRINTPSTIGGRNWCWRMEEADTTAELAGRIKKLTSLYGRF